MPLICPICRSGLDDAGSGVDCVALPCGHVFHQDCAMPWLTQQPRCAQCRKSVSNLATELTKIFFAASDGTESDELVYLHERLEQVQREKDAAKEEIKRANKCITELQDSSKDTESHADKMLDDLVAHQQELNQAKNRLRESQRDQKELSLRLKEAEQRADLYQRKLKRLQEGHQKSDGLQSQPPDLTMLPVSESAEMELAPQALSERKRPVPRPRIHRPASSKNVQDVKDTNTSVHDVQDTNTSVHDVQDTNTSAQDVQDTNTSVHDVQDTNTSVHDVQDTNTSAQDVQDTNASAQDVQDTNTSVQDVQDTNTSVQNMDTGNVFSSDVESAETMSTTVTPMQEDEKRVDVSDELIEPWQHQSSLRLAFEETV